MIDGLDFFVADAEEIRMNLGDVAPELSNILNKMQFTWLKARTRAQVTTDPENAQNVTGIATPAENQGAAHVAEAGREGGKAGRPRHGSTCFQDRQ